MEQLKGPISNRRVTKFRVWPPVLYPSNPTITQKHSEYYGRVSKLIENFATLYDNGTGAIMATWLLWAVKAGRRYNVTKGIAVIPGHAN